MTDWQYYVLLAALLLIWLQVERGFARHFAAIRDLRTQMDELELQMREIRRPTNFHYTPE